jgi:hypothetical protein
VAFVPLDTAGERVALYFSVDTSDSLGGLRNEEIGRDQSERNGNAWQGEVLLTSQEAETLKALFRPRSRGPRNIIAFIDACGERIFGPKAWHEGLDWRGFRSGGLPPIGPQFRLWNTNAVILLSTETLQEPSNNFSPGRKGFLGMGRTPDTSTATYKTRPVMPKQPMQFPDMGRDIPPG